MICGHHWLRPLLCCGMFLLFMSAHRQSFGDSVDGLSVGSNAPWLMPVCIDLAQGVSECHVGNGSEMFAFTQVSDARHSKDKKKADCSLMLAYVSRDITSAVSS